MLELKKAKRAKIKKKDFSERYWVTGVPHFLTRRWSVFSDWDIFRHFLPSAVPSLSLVLLVAGLSIAGGVIHVWDISVTRDSISLPVNCQLSEYGSLFVTGELLPAVCDCCLVQCSCNQLYMSADSNFSERRTIEDIWRPSLLHHQQNKTRLSHRKCHVVGLFTECFAHETPPKIRHHHHHHHFLY